MTDHDLIRFLDAQDQIYEQVVEELAEGRKETIGCGSFFHNSRDSDEAPWRSVTLYGI